MVATRVIKPGETILSERALFVVTGQRREDPQDFWRREYGAVGIGAAQAGYGAKIGSAVAGLNAADRGHFDRLVAHPAHAAYTPPQQIVDRMVVNSFDDFEEARNGHQWRRHWAVFDLTSKINPSCRPNSAAHLTWTNGIVGGTNANGTVIRPTATVRAVARIERGDEITIDYYGHIPNNFKNTATRQNLLQSCYGFLCACPACTDADPSDRRRQFIRQALTLTRLRDSTREDRRNISLPGAPTALLRTRVRDYLHAVQEEGIRDFRLGTA
jgi:hypothetical protein